MAESRAHLAGSGSGSDSIPHTARPMRSAGRLAANRRLAGALAIGVIALEGFVGFSLAGHDGHLRHGRAIAGAARNGKAQGQNKNS